LSYPLYDAISLPHPELKFHKKQRKTLPAESETAAYPETGKEFVPRENSEPAHRMHRSPEISVKYLREN